MSEVFIIEEYAIALLVIATLVGIVARRLRMPYTVGLVIVGAALAIFFRQAPVEVNPDIILGVFIPPLIFEAAFHLPMPELRRNIFSILRLAIVGVLITTIFDLKACHCRRFDHHIFGGLHCSFRCRHSA